MQWEDLIVSGLKRSATGPPSGRTGADQGRQETGAAVVGVTAAVSTMRVLRRLGTWAAGRSISPNSLSGISLLVALCAAAWFTGGTGQDSARGAFAMIGWLAMLAIARWLAVFVSRRTAPEQAAATRAHAAPGLPFDWAWSVSAVAGECAIYGGMAAGNEAGGLASVWPLAVGTVIAVATAQLLGACVEVALANAPFEPSPGTGGATRWVGRLLRLPVAVRGSVALLGFAFSGAHGALFAVLEVSVLPVAVTVAILGHIAPSARRVAKQRSASARRSAASRSTDADQRGFIWAPATQAGGVASRSAPGRPAPPAATSGISIITGPESRARSRGTAGASASGRVKESAEAGAVADACGSAEAGPVAYAWGSAEAGQVAYAGGVSLIGAGATEADIAGAQGGWADPRGATEADVAAGGACADPSGAGFQAKTGGSPSDRPNTRAAASDVVLALRDDGAVSRWAGRLVQGNLIPLPPALAGLVATSLLAGLDLRNLAAFVVLTPPSVMMLAAPGSSHPHDRRFDWLVPVLLALAQYVYLAPLGFALKVPGPVIFAACALIFVWYTGLIANEAAGSGGRTSIGWETRMFVIGLASAFGLATFGYVGLATYAGVLICRNVMTGYLVPGEEDRQ